MKIAIEATLRQSGKVSFYVIGYIDGEHTILTTEHVGLVTPNDYCEASRTHSEMYHVLRGVRLGLNSAYEFASKVDIETIITMAAEAVRLEGQPLTKNI